MGYYSEYRLEVIPKNGHSIFVIRDKFLDNLKTVIRGSFSYASLFEEKVKWYNHESDCTKASLGITEGIFLLDAKGKDGAQWAYAFYDGNVIWCDDREISDKVHLPFDKMVNIGFKDEAVDRYEEMGLAIPGAEPKSPPEPKMEEYMSPLLDKFFKLLGT